MGIRVALFGQPRVVTSDGATELALPRKTLNVLAYLILNYRRPPTRDTVAFALFPEEEEEHARSSLRRNLSYLISALPGGKQYVTADAERIAWNLDAPAHVDVIAFERAMQEGDDEQAIAEYAGQLLPTLYDEWTAASRERYRDLFCQALSRTIARERSLRRFDAATAFAHRLLDEDPWREDVVRQLVAIRFEAGDRAGALAAFERFAQRLREEMNAEPMAETLAVRDAVLRGTPLASSEPARPSAEGAPRDPGLPFVGRDESMANARDAWHAAADGRSGVLFVCAEAGGGKSRLVTEFARLVESEGGTVLRGYTPPGGERRPYEAFADALRDAPDLFDDGTQAALVDDRSARVRLFHCVTKHLADRARRRVMVLVLEDLHWAGTATIDLLDFVAERLEREPILVVGTFRGDELPQAHPLRALRRQLRGRGSFTEIALPRLAPGEAAAAVRAVVPPTVDDAEIARMVGWADGLPLLLDEAARDLAAGRPSSARHIAGLVDERFSRLSEPARTALELAALYGERFDLDTLAGVTGWREDELIAILGEGVEAALLRVTPRSHGLSFIFRHELIRAASLERMPPRERMRAHGLIAHAMSSHQGAAGSMAGSIAKHFDAAGDARRAAAYYALAARYALDLYANDEAAELSTTGLRLCDEGDRAQTRYELLCTRELALARLGALERRREDARALVELAQGDRAVGALERYFDAHAEVPEKRAEAIAALAELVPSVPRARGAAAYLGARDALLAGDFVRARRLALEAAQAFEVVGETRSALQARITHLLALRNSAAGDEVARIVDTLRPAIQDGDDLAMATEFHRVASSVISEPSAAAQDARRSLALALRIGDRFAEARARQNLAVAVAKLGAYAEAIDEQTRGLAAYRDIGNVEGVADSLVNLAAWRLYCGDLHGATPLLDELDPIDRHAPYMTLKIAQIRAGIALRMARPDARALLLGVRERAGALQLPYFVARANRELARLCALEGNLAEASAFAGSAIEGFLPIGFRASTAEAYALSARVCAMLGDAEEARERAARSIELAQGLFQALDTVHWDVAAAYALIGDRPAAIRFAESAAAEAVREALGMPADLAEAFLALPHHRHTVDFLWGREVPLRLEGSGERG